MAAFQFTVQQVSFSSEDYPLDSSSVDSLNSVVDPNVDFLMDADTSLDEKTIRTEEWKTSTSNKPIITAENNLENVADSITSHSPSYIMSSSSSFEPVYPSIPLAVAHYINENSPEICQEAEKYFDAHISSKSLSMQSNSEDSSSTSPLQSMSIVTEALALQHSVIGNYGVKPVSADIVAQVVANTRNLIEKGNIKYEKDLSQNITNNILSNGSNGNKLESDKAVLIRYPAESISSIVEKRSWFSKTPSCESHENLSMPKISSKRSINENFLDSRSSSQNSINSINSKKNSCDPEIPKVHSKISIPKLSGNHSDKIDSPYEQYPDSSVDYETESSISEKFERESLCSETFETESNFSEISGIDDEIFQIRKLQTSKTVASSIKCHSKNSFHKEKTHSLVKNGDQSSVITSEKSTETDDQYSFQLLREKASLEGRLETVSSDQNELIKERDNFRSLATSLEVQLKSLQNQLSSAIVEKKSLLQQLDLQSKEHKNWDNVIKEYQNIIECKNSEIKGFKEDLSQSEQEHTKTKISLEELKVEMESKDGAVSGLKKKIAELHVEAQVLLQGKIQLENEVKNIRLEMETLQKSKEWFQEQLHITQENRNKLHQELILTQSNLVETSNSQEKLLAEKTHLRHELVQIQQRAVTEKEVLMKRLETIEADMKERESLFDEIQNDNGTAESVLVERIRKLEEEKSQLQNQVFAISDKDFEMTSLKNDYNEKAKNIASLEKEKAELNKQIAILQKTSNDKDLNNQKLLQDIKDIQDKFNHANASLIHAEELINTLKEERTAADVALASANEEKRAVDESLSDVRENMQKLMLTFKRMKAEMVSKASQNEHLLKEKQVLEETVKKYEENVVYLKKEFEQQVQSENQNRNVMFDDLKKSKSDVESVLNVYSKDLLNYQQIVENLAKQKAELSSEVLNLKSFIESDKNKAKALIDENVSLKKKVIELEEMRACVTKMTSEGSSSSCLTSDDNQKQIALKSRKILYKKLKEKIKECEVLKNEIESIKEKNSVKNQDFNNLSSEVLESKVEENKIHEQFKTELQLMKKLLDEQTHIQKLNEETILQLEKEKGKRMGFEEKYDYAKQRMSELELSLTEKDSQIMQLNCRVEELVRLLEELDSSFKSHVVSAEYDLNKEKSLVKSLRQQIFQEKRSNSHSKREILAMKSALDQANQISDAKKQDIISLQAELSVKVQAELKHRAEIEHFQTEVRLHQSIIEKLNKELEEVKARDPALAEQIKALSWSLKEKSNEIFALKEKQNLMVQRHKVEVDSFKKNLESVENELETIKTELTKTREEKFTYQSKVIELRKALKAKLAELEAKGILRVENKTSNKGPMIHLNIPDPEVSFDEAYVNNLLQKSMHLSESRPLSNLQECLDSLKKEMVELQKKITDTAEVV